MKKDLGIIFGLAIFVVLLLVLGKGFTSTSFISSQNQQDVKKDETPVSVKGLSVTAKIAASSEDRKKGLSKMDTLPFDRGMLFVFDKSDVYGIWMKDMRFAIDIVWIAEDKSIVDLAQNVPPEPGKKDSELTVYKPKSPSRYILEINAGLAKINNLQVGDKVDFALQ